MGVRTILGITVRIEIGTGVRRTSEYANKATTRIKRVPGGWIHRAGQGSDSTFIPEPVTEMDRVVKATFEKMSPYPALDKIGQGEDLTEIIDDRDPLKDWSGSERGPDRGQQSTVEILDHLAEITPNRTPGEIIKELEDLILGIKSSNQETLWMS